MAHKDIHALLVGISHNLTTYAAVGELFKDFVAPRPTILVMGCTM